MPDGRHCGFTKLGGRTLLSWQIDLARDLGCERVVCLTDAKSEALEDVQDQVLQFGGEFHAISGPLPLVSLLSADQELVVVADGLVADRSQVRSLFAGTRGVLALPDEAGIRAGFERIDADHAWGGILVARAHIAEPLAQMPEDSDTISLLLRLALQAGTKLKPLDPAIVEAGGWLLVRDKTALEQREQALLSGAVERASWWSPSKAISRRIARLVAPEGLDRGPLLAGAVGATGILGALIGAFLEYPALGLASAALAALALSCREGMLRLATRLHGAEPRSVSAWQNLLFDLLIVVLLAWPVDLQNFPQRLFLPVLLLLSCRLGSKIWRNPFAQILSDRSVIAALLAVATALGVQNLTIGAISLSVLALSLYFQSKNRITQA